MIFKYYIKQSIIYFAMAMTQQPENTDIVHPIMNANEIDVLRNDIMRDEAPSAENELNQMIIKNKLIAVKGIMSIKHKMPIDRNLFKKIFSYYDPVEVVNEFLNWFPLNHFGQPYHNTANIYAADQNSTDVNIANRTDLDVSPIYNRIKQCVHIEYRTYNLRIIHGYNYDPCEYSTMFEGYPHHASRGDDMKGISEETGESVGIANVNLADPESDDLPPTMPVLYRIYRPLYQTLEFRNGKPYQWRELDIDYDSTQTVDLFLLYQYLIETGFKRGAH
jgi:hypothetical protein